MPRAPHCGCFCVSWGWAPSIGKNATPFETSYRRRAVEGSHLGKTKATRGSRKNKMKALAPLFRYWAKAPGAFLQFHLSPLPCPSAHQSFAPYHQAELHLYPAPTRQTTFLHFNTFLNRRQNKYSAPWFGYIRVIDVDILFCLRTTFQENKY